MVLAATTVIAAVSAAAALGTLLVYLYSLRRGGQSAARDEALALAETRRQMVIELRKRLEALERRQRRAHKRIRALDEALKRSRREARNRADQVERGHRLALEESLRRVRIRLEEDPPDVEGALGTIRALLADDELPRSVR